ncbi:MAG: PAQR family membrane homeostasis protein TrhA [Acidimicrobiales bacterium]
MSNDVAETAKPLLRGWLHAVAAPSAVVAGAVLVALASGSRARVACAIYSVTVVVLFAVSAIYHRGSWSPKIWLLLKRLDHANIFLAIAGSYTPFALLVLHGDVGIAILVVVWVGALAGVLMSVLWPQAPRAVIVPVYASLGCVAVPIMPEILQNGGVGVFVLVAAGGAIYLMGGVAYALRKPKRSAWVFGYHEVFHACTIAAYLAQYAAISIVAYRL